MKKISFVILLFITATSNAQETFHPVVKVEFEKVVYVRQQYKELNPEWYEQFKNQFPEQSVNYYEFIGDTAKSLFKETKEANVNARSWYQPIADKNVVYNDYANGKTINF